MSRLKKKSNKAYLLEVLFANSKRKTIGGLGSDYV